MTLTLITGARGAGKTTLLRAQVAARAAAGETVGGIASPAVFVDGQRAGYDLLDLRTGALRLLARVVTTPCEVPTIGSYRFDEAAVQAGNAAIIAAVAGGLDVVAIDEVGPLELAGLGWAPGLVHALVNCAGGQELILVVRTTLAAALPRHFPAPLWAGARHIAAGDAAAR